MRSRRPGGGRGAFDVVSALLSEKVLEWWMISHCIRGNLLAFFDNSSAGNLLTIFKGMRKFFGWGEGVGERVASILENCFFLAGFRPMKSCYPVRPSWKPLEKVEGAVIIEDEPKGMVGTPSLSTVFLQPAKWTVTGELVRWQVFEIFDVSNRWWIHWKLNVGILGQLKFENPNKIIFILFR